MITSGHFIGEILDELAGIMTQVELRAALHFYDLPAYAENFCRDVMTSILGGDFVNLNATKANTPGLDLGSKSLKVAVQVTATNTSKKVNDTLSAITDVQRSDYDRFIVLMLVKKQNSYTLLPDLVAKNHFDPKDIWDLRDLAKLAVDLPLSQLRELHTVIREQTARLKVDLELRPVGGAFSTTSYTQWEARPTPKVGSGESFIQHLESQGESLSDRQRALVKPALDLVAANLAELPRQTREFLVMLFERASKSGTGHFKQDQGWESILLSNLERVYQGQDLKGELDILIDAGFAQIEFEDRSDDRGPTAVGFKIALKQLRSLDIYFREFLEANDIGLRTALGDIDLSSF